MRFRILGPLALTYEDLDITPTAPKIRQVVAYLLVCRNQIVQVDELIDELWGEDPPESSMTTLQTYIYKLRRDVFNHAELGRLRTRASGYMLDTAGENVDAYRFEQLAHQGRVAHDRGDVRRASELLTEALALWRGNALAGVAVGEHLSAHVTRLEENRLRVLSMRIEADLVLGRYDELVGELEALVSRYPLHERFHANLMTALIRSGQRYAARNVYGMLHERMRDELGLEPSPVVQRLHPALHDAESTGPAPAPRRTSPAGGLAVLARLRIPAQLPPDTPDFSGRGEVVGRVRTRLGTHHDSPTTARAVAISGMPGVGKTTVALRVSHLVKDRHPDGQLFIDLRSSSAEPVPARDALAGFLLALGVPEPDLPPTMEERSGLFRTLSSGRRLLVLLDDADNASQIAPLIPATPQSTVIVTGRWGMHGLPGVRTITLGVLEPAEAVEQLGHLIGPGRVAAEPEQARRLVDLCGRVPLAVRCVGARLAAGPTCSMSRMARLIESASTALDQLRQGELDVRAGYHETYFRLQPRDRSALRLLSLLPSGPFTATTAARLLGAPADLVDAQLTRLVAAHLLEAGREAGTEVIRYQMHRLTRLYAQERLTREFIRPEAAARPDRVA